MSSLTHPHSTTPRVPHRGSLPVRYRWTYVSLRASNAFSLVELLVVVAIISIMAGILGLGLKGMKSSAIQGAASQVTSGLSLARQLAITKNTKAALLIETNSVNGRVPFRHWSVVYSNISSNNWTLAKKWEALPEGAVFVEAISGNYSPILKKDISGSPVPGPINAPSDFITNAFTILPSTTSSNLPCIIFSSDGAASITGNSTTAAIRIASGVVDTNGDVTLTSTNQYYFVETDSIVGRIRMRAPESYK